MEKVGTKGSRGAESAADQSRNTVASAAKKGGKNRRLTQEERTAISDKRMFDAAMQLISEQGAHRTTLKDICEKAGYSRGLANYRFGSKDAFFDRLISDFNHAWTEKLLRHVGNKTGLPAVLAAVDAFEQFVLEHGNYMRGRYIIMYESIATENILHSRLRANHKAYQDDIQKWVSEGVREGSVCGDIDADSFASYYCSFIFGTVYQWLVNHAQIDISKTCEFFRKQVRKTLSP